MANNLRMERGKDGLAIRLLQRGFVFLGFPCVYSIYLWLHFYNKCLIYLNMIKKA